MFLPGTKAGKSKPLYSRDCRRQDPGTGLPSTPLPKTGYARVRIFALQRTGKNSTGFLLKVVGMHA